MLGFCLIYIYIAPALLLPFIHILPYLHSFELWQRLLISLGGFLALLKLTVILSAFQNRQYLLAMMKGWRGFILTVSGWGMFIFIGACLSANSLGPLVILLPNVAYTEKMEVVDVQNIGSKYKAINLDIRSLSDGKIYYLTLSKQFFNSPKLKKLKIGDVLLLNGERNWFGVHISNVNVAE